MDEKRKRMGVRGWTVTAICLLMAYPLSEGPVGCIEAALLFPDWLLDVTLFLYRPVYEILLVGPTWLDDAHTGYLSWWRNCGFELWKRWTP